MDYKQRYKESLKVIEGLYNVVRYQSSTDALFASQTIEKAFPELAESEDERIRKELIKHIKANKCADYILFKKFSPDDVIAWLEKQGEKTIPKNIDDAALQYVDTCAVDGEVTHGNITEPYWNNHSMMAAYKAGWLEKQGELPSWSKEDENMRESVIDVLVNNTMSGSEGDKVYSEEIDWLRTLKSNHWKPSEEEMEALLYALGKGGTYNKEALTQLYNNLKTF